MKETFTLLVCLDLSISSEQSDEIAQAAARCCDRSCKCPFSCFTRLKWFRCNGYPKPVGKFRPSEGNEKLTGEVPVPVGVVHRVQHVVPTAQLDAV